MAKRLPYAAWVRQQLERMPEELRQAARGEYYSDSGKIAKWELYKADCKQAGYEYDGPPDGYWEAKEEPWHKPAGYTMGALGVFLTFLGMIIIGSMGTGKQRY